MSESLPWMKFYPRETLADGHFSGWSLEERGAWITLILHNWTEESLPSDLPSLARLLHIDHQAMRGLWSALGSRFIPHPDMPGRITSPRLEKEREAAKLLVVKRGEAGKKGATSRWDKEKKRHGKRMANAYQPHADANATAMRFDGDPDPAYQGQIQDQEQRENQPTKGVPLAVVSSMPEPGLLLFRTRLAERLALEKPIDIGKDRDGVLATFRRHLDAVGEETLLSDCMALATKSSTGVPSSLAWFVRWLDNLPMKKPGGVQ